MVYVHDIHRLNQFPRSLGIANIKVMPFHHKGQSRRADDVRFVIIIIQTAEGEHENLVPGLLKHAFIKNDIVGHPTNMRFIDIHQHPDSHSDLYSRGIGEFYGNFGMLHRIYCHHTNLHYYSSTGFFMASAAQQFRLSNSTIGISAGED